ncbi:HNH endonuclease [Halomonas sp. FL8]|uniref:HNH endonuclease n=1 Tax=unclassified Halomonas TaxID=2609666 RepID=UPI00345F4D3E
MREYLLEGWDCLCAYWGTKESPLGIDHIISRATGGSDRISNRTLTCHGCINERTRAKH